MAVVDNVKIGACNVYIDYSDGNGEIDLGQTKGGVKFIYSREFQPLEVDQFSSPLDMVLKGSELKVEVNLAEITNANLSKAAPEGDYDEGVGGDGKIAFGRDRGYSLAQNAGILRLHPLANDPADRDEDVYLWKAISIESTELDYMVDSQRILKITFQALIDEAREDGSRLGRIGDDTIS